MEAENRGGGRQFQRVLWAIGEARRRRLNPPDAADRASGAGQAGSTVPAGTAADVGLTPWTANGACLDLSVAVRGGQALLNVVGELDAETAPRLMGRVQALADDGARSVIVDLGGAAVGAGGLDVLVAASALLEELNGELVLKSPRAHALRLLDLAGLSNSFVIC